MAVAAERRVEVQHRHGSLRRGLAASVLLLLLAAIAAAPAGAAYSPKLKRYPYLTDVVGTSATVNWATDRSSSTAVVKYGQVAGASCTADTAAASRTSISVDSVNEYQWTARFAVEPDTEYCYRVYLGSSEDLLGTDTSPRFTSQLLPGSGEPYEFAVFGDWGYVDSADQNPNQAALLARIANSGARFALTAGDNLHTSGSQSDYGDLVYSRSRVFAPDFWAVPGRSIPIFPALGNHGFRDTHLVNFPQQHAVATSGGRYEVETRCCLNGTSSQEDPSSWYAFDAGNARMYVLEAAWPRGNVGSADIYKNDYDYHWTPGSDQYQWLENDLATHASQLKFAVFHFPLYSDSSAQQSDTFLQGLTSLEGLLSRYGVDIAFTGHAHIYERNVPSPGYGLVNYVTGGGGANPPVSIGSCSPFDAYAIGWSNQGSGGSSCRAPTPASREHVFHYLHVAVDGTSVTVTPTNQWGETFDAVTYDFPDEAAEADLRLEQSDSPDPVEAGETLTYSLTAHNDGPDDTASVTVTDTLPGGVSFQSASSSQGSCEETAGVVGCELGTLASGASATVEVRVVPASAGTLTNTASVSGTATDPDPGNNSDTETTTVVAGAQAADLSVSGSGSADPAGVGQTLTYAFTVRNGGPWPTAGVMLTDTLPATVTYSSASASQGTCSQLVAGTVSCSLGSLGVGATATVEIDVVPQARGTISNSATVSGDAPDPAPANNEATVSTEVVRMLTFTPSDDAYVRADEPAANFGSETELQVDASPVKDTLMKFAVSGVGTDTVVSAKLRLFAVNSSSGSGGEFHPVADTSWSESAVTYETAPAADPDPLGSLGPVSAGTWYEVDVTPLMTGDGPTSLRVTSPSSDGADYSSKEGADPPQLIVATRAPDEAADLELAKSGAPDPVLTQELLTYTLTVRNAGPDEARGVTLTDQLPATVTFDSALATQGICEQEDGVVTCDLGTLANGSEEEVEIKVRPQDAGSITNEATVHSEIADPDPGDDVASTETMVDPMAGYPRPKAASPLQVALVPAQVACTDPDAIHGEPLDHPSCRPPVPVSAHLTVGTPDANGAAANAAGFARLRTRLNAAPDPHEVDIGAAITDVRCAGDGGGCAASNDAGGRDYAGELQVMYELRITDRFSGEGGGTPATVTDTAFPVTMVCAGTAATSIGGTCEVSTTANAVLPGSVQSLYRSIWEIGRVQVFDGGSDGVAETAGNTLFAAQGIFVP